MQKSQRDVLLGLVLMAMVATISLSVAAAVRAR